MRYCAFVFLLILAVACTENHQNKLQSLEQTYYSAPDEAKAEALLSAYEQALQAEGLPEADQKDILIKTAAFYARINQSEGIASNFKRFMDQYPNDQDGASAIIDSVMLHMTDPSSQRLRPMIAAQYILLAEHYAQQQPDAEASPQRLYKAAEIARSVGSIPKAIELYSHIESFYPNYENAGKCLFMQGFIQAEDLQNKEAAREIYTRFLEKYPQDEFAPSAQFLLENLDKTDEEILQSFTEE